MEALPQELIRSHDKQIMTTQVALEVGAERSCLSGLPSALRPEYFVSNDQLHKSYTMVRPEPCVMHYSAAQVPEDEVLELVATSRETDCTSTGIGSSATTTHSRQTQTRWYKLRCRRRNSHIGKSALSIDKEE